MTAKEYVLSNTPRATFDICPFAHYVMYGIEHDINDYAYIAYETNGGIQSYHKLKIRYTADGIAYVFIHRTKLYMSEWEVIKNDY